jgi:hypothetical protein
MKNLACILPGALLLLCVSTRLAAQEASQNSVKIRTSLGNFSGQIVHLIPHGYYLVRMPDGHMRAENAATGDHIDYMDSASDVQQPATDAKQPPIYEAGIFTYSGWLNQTGTPITSFTTTWKVPPKPRTNLTLYATMLPNTDYNTYYGLEAQLTYGSLPGGITDDYWTIFPVYQEPGAVYLMPPVKVKPGQLVAAEFKLIGQSNGTYSYSLQFKGIKFTTLLIYDIAELTWCGELLEGSLNIQGHQTCDQLPNTAFTPLTINVRTGSTVPAVDWVQNNLQVACGVQSVIVKNGGNDALIHVYW